MLLLLHFVADNGWNPAPGTGYRGSTLESCDAGGLRCWYSNVSSAEIANFTAEDALVLHRLATAALAAGGVIPFRFPTAVETADELQRYLAENSARFRASLERVRGAVQMEVQISASEPSPPDPSLSPGRAYMTALRDKLSGVRAAEQEIAARASGLVLRWATSGQRRCVLVPIANVERFRHAAAAAQLPPGVQVRITGPWPATAFLDEVTRPAEPNS